MKGNYYIGLVPEIASFVTELDEVERLIGKGFVFHDAEIELVLLHIPGYENRHEALRELLPDKWAKKSN